MTISQSFYRILFLACVLLGLISYNFISAQWSEPTATAPNNNTAEPINISANYQAKLGDLGAVRMRAGQYCNAAGTVCTSDLGSGGSSGQYFAAIRGLGYGLPAAPAGLSVAEWPNGIICEFTSGSPLILYATAFEIGTNRVSYRAQLDGNGTIIYNSNGTLFDAQGAILKSSCGYANEAAGYPSTLQQLCSEGRCIW